MSTIKNWSTTAGNNNDAPPDGFPENMAPSGVNDSAREVMASVRAQWNQAEWFDYGDPPSRVSGTVFSLTGTHTATYAVGRRIRVKDTAGTLYGTISDQTLTGVATQVTVALDSGSLTATLTAVELGILAPTSDSLPATYRAGDGAVGTPSHTFRQDTDSGLYRIGADNIGIAIAGALAMEFDPIGAVQMPLQPAFLAQPSSVQSNIAVAGGAVDVAFATERFDQNADFATPSFTAPVDGRYLLSVLLDCSDIDSASTLIQAFIVTSNRTTTFYNIQPNKLLTHNHVEIQSGRTIGVPAGVRTFKRVIAGTLAKRMKPRIELVRQGTIAGVTRVRSTFEMRDSAFTSDRLSNRVPAGRTRTEQSSAITP